ncbi:hypothetical protein [Streptomyces sp. NBC_00236]|uniref:hypothetical protein n=1 Tax=Streptomyces sp. NBC_00236 TaxID=2903639 RepID=UPI002E2C32BD|nr:hypothetical protein [Streptomyces sp. NBC_00236]
MTPLTSVACSAWRVVAASGPSAYSRISFTAHPVSPGAVSVIRRWRTVSGAKTASWVKERPLTSATGSPHFLPSVLVETVKPDG